MSTPLTIRHFQETDYPGLLALWESAGLPAKPSGRDQLDKIRAELARGHGHLLLADQDGQLVGTVLATHDGRKGWINRLAVIPGRQRSGIARTLVQAAEEWLDKQGIEVIACLIEADNHVSRAVFQHLGYTGGVGITYHVKKRRPDA
jgi:GNAT superfamily N-acetyltransferase